MKEMFMIIVAIGIFGAACAYSNQQETTASKRERILQRDAEFLDQSYELVGVQELQMPLAEHAYILARKESQEIKIKKAEDFSNIVETIESAEQALAFVRFITSQEIRPFLRDIYYSEVYKKVEAASESDIVDPWFLLEAEQYDLWKVQAAAVSEEGKRYKIERFVASYPRKEQEELLPAQLLRIWEWVDADGKYVMEIQEVITEGDAIHAILLFRK